MKKHSSWKKISTRFTTQDEPGDPQNKLDNVNWDVDSELVIKFLTIPSSKNYTALRLQLQRCKSEWMREFLSHEGLQYVFIALKQTSERTSVKFLDAVMQVELVKCIKAVMNSKVGMEYVVENGVLVHKLALGKEQFLGGEGYLQGCYCSLN